MYARAAFRPTVPRLPGRGCRLCCDHAGVARPAFSFVRNFDPAPTRRLCVDRHYLLCARRGALRLEVDGTTWSLPPARAALIRAGIPIEVSIPQPVTTSSVLFCPHFTPPPPSTLGVLALTPPPPTPTPPSTPRGHEGATP